MAEDNLKSLTINSILIGLLMLSLTSFYIVIVNNEGRGEIFDDYPEISELNLNLYANFTGEHLIDTANINSNLSANYNPEVAISAADQSGNAIAINFEDLTKSTWALVNVLGGLLFGSVFRAISTLITFIIASLGAYYFIKFIRSGT